MVSALVPTLPVVMTNAAGKSVVAGSAAEYWRALWSGYVTTGPVPAPPRNKVPATLADLDGLKGAAPADLDTLKEVSDELKGRLASSALSATFAPRAHGLGPRDFPQRPKVTLLTTFQSGHGWSIAPDAGVTQTADTADYMLGSQSMKSVHASGFIKVKYTKTGLPAVNMTGKGIAVLLKLDDPATFQDLNFGIGNTGLANVTNYKFSRGRPGVTAIGQNFRPGEWTWCYVVPSEVTGTAGTFDLTNITDWQISIQSASGTTNATAHVGAVGYYTVPTAYPNGVVTFGFDDSLGSQYALAKPALDKYGWGANAFTITDLVNKPTYMTTAQLHDLEDNHGWEVSGHAYYQANHNAGLPNLSDAVLFDDLYRVKDWLRTEGFRGADFFAWPLGAENAVTAAKVAKFFSFARHVDGNDLESLPPATPMRAKAYTVTSTTTALDISNQIDIAYARGRWLQLVFHDQVASGATGSTANNVAILQSAVDYCNTKGIPVRTVGEVLRKTA